METAGKVYRFCCCCLALVIIVALPAEGSCFEHELLLNGRHRFAPGDDPARALTTYDDSQWREIDIPGSWQSQGFEPEGYFGWYRIHFAVTGPLPVADIAVYLGAIGNADETFLNGVKIGGEGVLGDRPIEATMTRRLYRIPPDLLKPLRENVLAVRVMNTYYRGGIWEGPLLIGGYRDLLFMKKATETKRKNAELVVFTFFGIVLILYLFLYLNGTREKEYTFFGLLAIGFIVLYLLESLIFYETGLKNHLAVTAIFALTALLPANLLLFLAEAGRERPTPLLKLLTASFVLMAVAVVVAPGMRWYKIIIDLWTIAIFIAAAMALFILLRAWRRSTPETGYILLGTGLLFVGLFLEGLQSWGIFPDRDFHGETAAMVSVPLMFMCVMFAMASRFSRMAGEARAFSGRLIRAHEKERKRLARDLHDGVGQTLSLLKLKVQTLAAGSTGGRQGVGEALHELAGQVSSAMEELRSVAMDIRPSFLEEMNLMEALRWYGDSFRKKTGIAVLVEGDECAVELKPEVKENLYRICQEALGNVRKHAGADRVCITIGREGGFFTLVIKDNGDGFVAAGPENRKRLGLETMKERAGLLGGKCAVKSAPGQGTAVRVEVPVP